MIGHSVCMCMCVWAGLDQWVAKTGAVYFITASRKT